MDVAPAAEPIEPHHLPPPFSGEVRGIALTAAASVPRPNQYRPPAAARYYLWDGTPVGPALVRVPEDQRPESIRVQPQALRALLDATARKGVTPCPGVTILGFLVGRRVERQDGHGLVMDRFDPGRRRRSVGPDEAMDVEPTFVTACDAVVPVVKVPSPPYDRPEARYRYFLQDSIRRTAESGSESSADPPSWLSVHYDEAYQIRALQYTLLIPDVTLRMIPIHSLRLVPCTVATKLERNTDGTDKTIGYATIDQARHILVLAASDPMTASLPLVGIWSKNHGLKSPELHAACVRYIMNESFKKLDTGRRTMLLAIAEARSESGRGSAPISFFECTFEIKSSTMTMFTQTITAASQEAQIEADGDKVVDGTLDGTTRCWSHVADAGTAVTFKDVVPVDVRTDGDLCDVIEDVLHAGPIQRITAQDRLDENLDEPAADSVMDAGDEVDEPDFLSREDDGKGEDAQQEEQPTPSSDDPPTPSDPIPGSLQAAPSSSGIPLLEQNQLYIAILQQQMDMLRGQMDASRLHATIGQSMLSTTNTPLSGHAQLPPGATTSSPPVILADAATNTTLVVDVSTNPQPQPSPTESHAKAKPDRTAGTSPPPAPPPAAAPPPLVFAPSPHTIVIPAPAPPPRCSSTNNNRTEERTNGHGHGHEETEADLESVLRKVNRTTIEHVHAFPPDTGTNYRPFFLHDGGGRGSEGPTVRLLRTVERVLDEEDGIVVEDLEEDEDEDGCGDGDEDVDGEHDASVRVIERLAMHPDARFIVLDENGDGDGRDNGMTLVFKDGGPREREKERVRTKTDARAGCGYLDVDTKDQENGRESSAKDEKEREGDDQERQEDREVEEEDTTRREPYSIATEEYFRRHGLA
ncbi:hypothetical protein HKX48_007043 [Thoreauomyces humboldtii]|nr:hypothetical protein HKX48_007043 [Thoreauomyces humboldtii]